MNPSKRAGTAWETSIVNQAHLKGLKAWRLAEGGENDPGDIAIQTPSGDTYVIEAKHRSQLNIHAALSKAAAKAVAADLPFSVVGVAVAWKRLVSKGGARRVSAGAPVMAITVKEWLSLISR